MSILGARDLPFLANLMDLGDPQLYNLAMLLVTFAIFLGVV